MGFLRMNVKFCAPGSFIGLPHEHLFAVLKSKVDYLNDKSDQREDGSEYPKNYKFIEKFSYHVS